MADVIIKVDKSDAEVTVVRIIGPLDNRTAEGFDSWLDSFVKENGADGKVHFDLDELEIMTSRAVSTLAYYFDVFSKSGGELRLRNVPEVADIVLKKLGLDGLGWVISK